MRFPQGRAQATRTSAGDGHLEGGAQQRGRAQPRVDVAADVDRLNERGAIRASGERQKECAQAHHVRVTARPPRCSAYSSRLRQMCTRARCADRARYSARARVAGQGSCRLAGNQGGGDPTHRGHRVHRRDGHRLGGHGHGDRHGDRRLGDGRGGRGLREQEGRSGSVAHAHVPRSPTHIVVLRKHPARRQQHSEDHGGAHGWRSGEGSLVWS